jgi:hypothetical protein
MEVFDDAGVGVVGEAGSGVAEEFLDDFDVDACGQRQGGRDVAEVVEADGW